MTSGKAMGHCSAFRPLCIFLLSCEVHTAVTGSMHMVLAKVQAHYENEADTCVLPVMNGKHPTIYYIKRGMFC